ncbi:MAG: hypothetical protein ACOCWW_00960 [Bacteroidota bacterium]
MSQNDKSVLFGKWVNYYDTNNYLIFDSDSFKIVNNNFEYSQTWTIKKSGTFLTQTEFDKTPSSYNYSFLDNFMVLLTMKPNLNQVDEVSLFVKNYISEQIPTINSKIRVFIKDYSPGLYMIRLPNFQRYKSNTDIKELRDITLNNKFIESSSLITPFDFAFKNFEFYLKDKKIPLFFREELLKAKKINTIQQDEDIIVCIYGFNQIGRETINNAMDKNIVGDILMFYIGPSKNYEIFPTALDLE